MLYSVVAVRQPQLSGVRVGLGVGVRAVVFLTTGLLLGWFAQRNRLLVGQLRRLAESDHLTGVGNARAYDSAIRRRTTNSDTFALLLCDMDGLKNVNDEQGHSAGDEALKELTRTLTSLLRSGDEIVRVGGDEFCLLAGVASRDEAAWLAARLEQQLGAAGCPATFGWAVHPFESNRGQSLFNLADQRLYARKAQRADTPPHHATTTSIGESAAAAAAGSSRASALRVVEAGAAAGGER